MQIDTLYNDNYNKETNLYQWGLLQERAIHNSHSVTKTSAPWESIQIAVY